MGKDAAEILGYKNTRQALASHVDAEDKLDGATIRDAIGREQNSVFINESGLYSLILSSKNRIICPIIKTISHFCRIAYSL